MKSLDLQALLVHTLKDVYFAENAILKALPKNGESGEERETNGSV